MYTSLALEMHENLTRQSASPTSSIADTVHYVVGNWYHFGRLFACN